MFDSEWDSLDFYHDHRAELEDREVFVRLTNADAFLLRESEVRYFNPADMVASLYWNERSVLDFVRGKRLQAQVAIVGFDALGQQLLRYALRRRLAARLAQQGLSFAEEELGETEHIRWARFYTLNHWESGATTRSSAEDFNDRVMACLAPYSQISEEDKARELARIKALAEKTAREAATPSAVRRRRRRPAHR